MLEAGRENLQKPIGVMWIAWAEIGSGSRHELRKQNRAGRPARAVFELIKEQYFRRGAVEPELHAKKNYAFGPETQGPDILFSSESTKLGYSLAGRSVYLAPRVPWEDALVAEETELQVRN